MGTSTSTHFNRYNIINVIKNKKVLANFFILEHRNDIISIGRTDFKSSDDEIYFELKKIDGDDIYEVIPEGNVDYTKDGLIWELKYNQIEITEGTKFRVVRGKRFMVNMYFIENGNKDNGTNIVRFIKEKNYQFDNKKLKYIGYDNSLYRFLFCFHNYNNEKLQCSLNFSKKDNILLFSSVTILVRCSKTMIEKGNYYQSINSNKPIKEMAHDYIFITGSGNKLKSYKGEKEAIDEKDIELTPVKKDVLKLDNYSIY